MQHHITTGKQASRVNITLDIATGGSQRKHELPLKLLAAGDFSHSKTTTALAMRPRHSINQDNFDETLAAIAPALSLQIPDSDDDNQTLSKVDLQFQRLRDFEPIHIIQQIPELKLLYAKRNLLMELQRLLSENSSLAQRLFDTLNQKPKVKSA